MAEGFAGGMNGRPHRGRKSGETGLGVATLDEDLFSVGVAVAESVEKL